jgi:hypothetical protein
MKKNDEKPRRPHSIAVYFTNEEFKIADSIFRKTTYAKWSEYGRKLFLNKPVRVIYRNASLDDLIEAVNRITRNEGFLLAQPELGRELKLLFHQIVDQCIRVSK